MHHDPLYPAFSAAEYERRYREVRARMDQKGVATILLYGRGSSPEIHYLSNWLTTTEAHLILPAEGSPTLFIQLSNHLPNAKRMAILEDVRFGGSSPTGSVDSLPLSGGWFVLPVRLPAAPAAQAGEKVRMRGDLSGTLASILSHRGRGSKKRFLDFGACVSWPVSLGLITNQASASGGGT